MTMGYIMEGPTWEDKLQEPPPWQRQDVTWAVPATHFYLFFPSLFLLPILPPLFFFFFFLKEKLSALFFGPVLVVSYRGRSFPRRWSSPCTHTTSSMLSKTCYLPGDCLVCGVWYWEKALAHSLLESEGKRNKIQAGAAMS